MGCLGVFIAIDSEQVDRLLHAADDDELLDRLESMEADLGDSNLAADCDKSWDALHRCLTDGRLDFGNGPYPLSHVVLGPRQLHKGDDFIVSLVLPEEVTDVAAALQAISEESFRDRYWQLVPSDYCDNHGEEDLQYTWEWFQPVRDLYRVASERRLAVVFSVDQ